MEEINNKIDPAEQEIDLIELAHKILKDWKVIFKSCGIAIIIALIAAFSFPKEYITIVRLAPEITDASAKNSLGGLAAMAGINLNSATGGDAFSPDLYPDIVKSTPFLLELFSIQVQDRSRSGHISLFDYMAEHQKDVWWNHILKAPFKLLGWIREFVGNEQPEALEYSAEESQIYTLDRGQQEVLETLQERISLSVDKKTSVITISVQMQDPLISAQLTQVVLENLQEYIITYRTQKVKQDLEFTEKIYTEAQNTYFDAQRKYASFKDANRHISSAVYATEEERLKNEMTLTYNVYNSLAQKLEQDRLRVQEQTPVFAVIEPAKVPLKPASPRKLIILIGFTFLGGVLAVGYILFKDSIQKIYAEIKAG